MGGACNTMVERRIQGFAGGDRRERDHLEDLGLDESVILKGILKNVFLFLIPPKNAQSVIIIVEITNKLLRHVSSSLFVISTIIVTDIYVHSLVELKIIKNARYHY